MRRAGVVGSAATARTYAGAQGIWSWWIRPLAVSHGGKTIFGSLADTQQFVTSIDNATKAVVTFTVSSGVYTEDDHNAPCVLPLSNGHLLVMYTGHDQDHIVRRRISTTGLVADLGAELQIPMAAENRTTTYAQAFEDPTVPGTVYCFMRLAVNNWYVISSTDYGATWSAERSIISTLKQFYCMIRLLPGRNMVRIFCYPNPNYVQNDMRVLDIDMSSLNRGLVITNGQGRGYLDGTGYNGASLPVTEAQIPLLRTPASGRSQRLLDTPETGEMIAFADHENADNSSGTYHLWRLTGSNPHDPASWTSEELASAGFPFYPGSNYYGGICFANEPHAGDRFYISQRLSGGPNLLQQWNCLDGSTWRKSTILLSSTERLLRPVSPRNADPRVAVLWQQGSYAAFDNWDMTVRGASTALRSWDLAKLRWEIRASFAVLEGQAAKFLISWYGVPIPAGTTCTIDLAESGTAAGADFTSTLDAAVAAAVAGATGVTYDSATNRLSITSAATSPLIVSRTVATGDAVDDLETWTLTLSNQSHGTIGTASATVNLIDPAGAPLNGLSTGASAAFGMDRLRSLYTGPAIRLRRSSDNAELDFGFDGAGLLDTAAITTWKGADNLFCAAWYDQSGNGQHAYETTAANQFPFILAATPNSRPVLRGSGSTHKLRVASLGNTAMNNIFAGGGYACAAFRMAGAGGNSLGRVFDKKSINLVRYLAATTVRFTRTFSNNSTRQWTSTVPTAGPAAWVVYGVEFDTTLGANLPVSRVNGSTAGTSEGAPTADGHLSDADSTDGGDLIIGNAVAGNRGIDGDIAALVWCQTQPPAGEGLATELTLKTQYGIT